MHVVLNRTAEHEGQHWPIIAVYHCIVTSRGHMAFALCLIVLIELLLLVLSANAAAGPRTQGVVLGIDAGTESLRAVLFDEEGNVVSSEVCEYPSGTQFPKNGWVEQLPEDWWSAMATAVNGVIEDCKRQGRPIDVKGMCVDTTACSVVVLNQKMKPLRPCLLWMDGRAAEQCDYILSKANGDSALSVNCGGEGPLSAEWMIPKALWIKEREPKTWEQTTFVCEKQDYLNYLLTGNFCMSGCNAAIRWHVDARRACDFQHEDKNAGRPVTLLQSIGLEDLLEKWPQQCIPMGEIVGQLSPSAAKYLSLPEGVPVIQGGPDAFVGMIGLGCINPGQLALITGSSHLQLCVTDKEMGAIGTWGAYNGAPLKTLNVVEGGQSSTGSVLSWARRSLFTSNSDSNSNGKLVHLPSYKELDAEASKVDIGAEGLIALETFQGSRTPKTDPLARGCLLGLSLLHTRGHIWRALMEAVCYGSRAAIEALRSAGHEVNSIMVAGGATRSDLWLQMHADATGIPVSTGIFDNSPVLGCGVLAAVGCGLHNSINDAITNMVHLQKKIEPSMERKAKYDKVYKQYRKLSPSVAHISRKLASDYSSDDTSTDYKPVETSFKMPNSGRKALIVPSLLSADFGSLASEARACHIAGAEWIHIDVCDGGSVAPGALTIGPGTVAAIKKAAPSTFLDVHVTADHPEEIISTIIDALKDGMGNSHKARITFQFESIPTVHEVIETATLIRNSGFSCGVSICPDTPIQDIGFLLQAHYIGENKLIDLVDVLAVNPGVAGQTFNSDVLDKVQLLYELDIVKYIMVDGGMNENTVVDAAQAGANVIVSGTSIFGKDRKASDGMEVVRSNMEKLGGLLQKHGL